MLISCPKCHNVYEIPDDLIPKTGKKFRCQSCSHIWHAMPSDALGYEEPQPETPIVEPIAVPVPPYRPYPADKEEYVVPADTKSGRKTVSSADLRQAEGQTDYQPQITPQKPELHLMSDEGTSFTISMPAPIPEKETFTSETRLTDTRPVASIKPKSNFLSDLGTILLLIMALTFFLRREIVTLWPETELYYQKIKLSGQNNPSFLEIKDVTLTPQTQNGTDGVLIKLTVSNDSFYQTRVPSLEIQPTKQTFKTEKELLKRYESTKAEVFIPNSDKTALQSLTIGFLKH